MNRLLLPSLCFVLSLLIWSCNDKKETSAIDLKEGVWRGTLAIQGQEVPFNLDIQRDSAGLYNVVIRNAGERLVLDDVSFDGDSVVIPLHIFDASLKARASDEELRGYFIKHYEKNYRIPFHAVYGVTHRFAEETKNSANTSFEGKYKVSFFEENDTTDAVGVFSQSGNKLTGTFLTPTGDYRFLEGTVAGDSMYLSTFDGNYVYLFRAAGNGQNISGRFYSGKTKNIEWQGVRDENASLPDAESMTYLKEGYDRIEFSFPDVDGKPVTLSDDKYRGKVVILQIFGTWCPNCLDETKFLAPWYNDNKSRGVEIIGLAYERKPDFAYASDRVKKMIDKLKVNYDFVIAGTNDKDKASETLPMLNRVMAFPTTIFIGKDGKVRKIHTGFSGPGTGVYFERLVEEFNQTVNELLAEGTSQPAAKL